MGGGGNLTITKGEEQVLSQKKSGPGRLYTIAAVLARRAVTASFMSMSVPSSVPDGTSLGGLAHTYKGPNPECDSP